MSTTAIPDRFATLTDEVALNATVVALEEHGFSVEVVDDLDAASEMKAIGGQPDYALGSVHAQHSQAGKILEIHTELPGRIHVVLVRQQVGY